MPLTSPAPTPRRALVVRGGWEGHAPVATTELFIPALAAAGFGVEVADDLDVYCDADHTDARDTVLATTVLDPADHGQGVAAVPMPVVWSRHWGLGKVFVSAIGHRVEDLREPSVRALTERGLVWAARH